MYRAPKTWFCLVHRSEAAWHFGWAFVQSCRSFLCSSASQCWRYQLRSSEMHVVCRDFLFVVVLTNSSRLLEPYRLYNKGQVLLILSLETLSSKCCGKERERRRRREEASSKTTTASDKTKKVTKHNHWFRLCNLKETLFVSYICTYYD